MFSSSVRPNNALTVLGRVKGVNGSDITQASLSTLKWKLVKQVDNTEVLSLASLTISSLVYDTLQIFIFPDGTTFSYNFKHIIPSSYFSTPGLVLIASYQFIDSSVNNYEFWTDYEINVTADP